MPILNFQKPDKVIMTSSDGNRAIFEFRPLEQGFGLTVGNALRRVLLSSLEGYAITSIKISGVDHEFDTIPGVVEDVIDIILNLKQVRFQNISNTNVGENISLSISGKDTFTAGDIQQFSTAFKILNPELRIATLEPSVRLNVDMTIEKGRGFLQAEENKKNYHPIGTIAIDSIFTPIKNVKYHVEDYRVEQKTDFEKLVLEIVTDGSITPKDALTEASKILIQHFMLFSDERIALEQESLSSSENYDEESLHMRQLLKTKLVDMDLSVRALNCLKAAELETLGELVAINKSDLMKFRNFGKKSLTELEELVQSKNLEFGMNLSKYKLDKE